MTSAIGPADLLKYHSGLKNTDVKNWHRIPASAAIPMPPEVKAQLAAADALEKQLKADYDAETAAHPERYSGAAESNVMSLRNVSTLSDDELQPNIGYITHLIQSGEADKYVFSSANGDQPTTSIHQYLFWLQQRVQGLGDDGTYSPDMVS